MFKSTKKATPHHRDTDKKEEGKAQKRLRMVDSDILSGMAPIDWKKPAGSLSEPDCPSSFMKASGRRCHLFCVSFDPTYCGSLISGQNTSS
ncbi:unnamed protein product [Victoria cruziana]